MLNQKLWGPRALVTVALVAALGTSWAGQPVVVDQAWVRPAVAGQAATGGYLRIEAHEDVTLKGFRTPVAQEAALHEMRMVGDVMQMREVDSLKLKAGDVLQLAPGQQHLMLMGLKRALKAGDKVPLALSFQATGGKPFIVKVDALVQTTPPATPAHQPH